MHHDHGKGAVDQQYVEDLILSPLLIYHDLDFTRLLLHRNARRLAFVLPSLFLSHTTTFYCSLIPIFWNIHHIIA